MDDEGQTYTIEVVILALLMVASLGFVSQLAPPQKHDFSSDQLKALGDSALRTLDNIPPSTEAELYHNSTLTKYIVTNDTDSLTDYLNETLQNIFYNVYITNGVSEKLLFFTGSFGDNVVTSHRLIIAPEGVCLIDGYTSCVYEVKLVMWHY
jgi:hypothetical protein